MPSLSTLSQALKRQFDQTEPPYFDSMALILFLTSLAVASISASSTQESTVVEGHSGPTCKLGHEACSTEEVASVSLIQSEVKLSQQQQLARDKKDANHHTAVTSATVQTPKPLDLTINVSLLSQSNVSLLSQSALPKKRYAKCWEAGTDQQSRDAACVGELTCSRRGFDGRTYGDCGQHCCSQETHNSKVGRGACPPPDTLDSGTGFTDESLVQDKCTELQCVYYIWSQDDGNAWFCSNDLYDQVENADEWPQWKVGRPNAAKGPGKRYGECYDAGSDMKSRDAACEGMLKCARAGHDGRSFGDCEKNHCCSVMDAKGAKEEAISSIGEAARRAAEDAARDEAHGYNSKAGRVGCSAPDTIHVGVGFTDESMVQTTCSDLNCAMYVWNNDDRGDQGAAWFCSNDVYDGVDNAGDWPQWKVGRPDKAKAAASAQMDDQSTMALGRYALCWDSGTDLASRDASCQGELKCAKKGFDSRNFGDCEKHCCSLDPMAEVKAKSKKASQETEIKLAGENAKKAAEDAARDQVNGYDSKVGRGACAQEDFLGSGAGYEDESMVQEKCSELHCASYVWSNDDEEKGHAYFCRSEVFDTVTNGEQWPQWKSGRPSKAGGRYQSKVGRGGCPEEDILYHEVGIADESMVQDKCMACGCAFYVWSNDDQDGQGSAWFCQRDVYDSVTNADQWPKWKVGRPNKVQKMIDANMMATTNKVDFAVPTMSLFDAQGNMVEVRSRMNGEQVTKHTAKAKSGAAAVAASLWFTSSLLVFTL